MKEKVVVTGIGALTPLGLNVEESWQATLAGQFSAEQIEPQSERSDVHYAAFIKGFDPANYIKDDKLIKRRSIPTLLSYAAAKQALTNARLPRAETTSQAVRRGVVVGSGISNFLSLLKDHDFYREQGRVKSDTALRVEPEQAATIINQLEYFMGPTEEIAAACASGASAIAAGARLIENEEADVVVAVGVDSLLHKNSDGSLYHPISIATYEAAGALAKGLVEQPSLISKPFSKDRRGFVIGECAAALVLESFTHAKRKGAEILAEVKGHASTNGATDPTNPTVEGQLAAMRIATQRAGLKPCDLTHGNMHGTGTEAGDPAELVSTILYREGNLDGLFLSATKSMTCHGIGGTGAWEAAELVLAIRDGVVPPTPNFGELLDIPDKLASRYPIPDCYKDYPLLFSRTPLKTDIKNCFTNSFGFGDINVTLVFGQPD